MITQTWDNPSLHTVQYSCTKPGNLKRHMQCTQFFRRAPFCNFFFFLRQKYGRLTGNKTGKIQAVPSFAAFSFAPACSERYWAFPQLNNALNVHFICPQSNSSYTKAINLKTHMIAHSVGNPHLPTVQLILPRCPKPMVWNIHSRMRRLWTPSCYFFTITACPEVLNQHSTALKVPMILAPTQNFCSETDHIIHFCVASETK